jgi:hypothetical protein
MVSCLAPLGFFLLLSTFVACFVLDPCYIEVVGFNHNSDLLGVLLYATLQQTA